MFRKLAFAATLLVLFGVLASGIILPARPVVAEVTWTCDSVTVGPNTVTINGSGNWFSLLNLATGQVIGPQRSKTFPLPAPGEWRGRSADNQNGPWTSSGCKFTVKAPPTATPTATSTKTPTVTPSPSPTPTATATNTRVPMHAECVGNGISVTNGEEASLVFRQGDRLELYAIEPGANGFWPLPGLGRWSWEILYFPFKGECGEEPTPTNTPTWTPVPPSATPSPTGTPVPTETPTASPTPTSTPAPWAACTILSEGQPHFSWGDLPPTDGGWWLWIITRGEQAPMAPIRMTTPGGSYPAPPDNVGWQILRGGPSGEVVFSGGQCGTPTNDPPDGEPDMVIPRGFLPLVNN